MAVVVKPPAPSLFSPELKIEFKKKLSDIKNDFEEDFGFSFFDFARFLVVRARQRTSSPRGRPRVGSSRERQMG